MYNHLIILKLNKSQQKNYTEKKVYNALNHFKMFSGMVTIWGLSCGSMSEWVVWTVVTSVRGSWPQWECDLSETVTSRSGLWPQYLHERHGWSTQKQQCEENHDQGRCDQNTTSFIRQFQVETDREGYSPSQT